MTGTLSKNSYLYFNETFPVYERKLLKNVRKDV